MLFTIIGLVAVENAKDMRKKKKKKKKKKKILVVQMPSYPPK